MAVHQGRWCDGGNTIRSRRGSLADKLVQHKKRKAEEEKRHQCTLDNTEIENVLSVTYLGSFFQADGDGMANAKHRFNISHAVFNGLHHLSETAASSMEMRLYKTTVCSSLTHEFETWDMTYNCSPHSAWFQQQILQCHIQMWYPGNDSKPSLLLNDYNSKKTDWYFLDIFSAWHQTGLCKELF